MHNTGGIEAPNAGKLCAGFSELRFYSLDPTRNRLVRECGVLGLPRFIVESRLGRCIVFVLTVQVHGILRQSVRQMRRVSLRGAHTPLK
jgi:hypothetical protein